jgi:hypothetical protein
MNRQPKNRQPKNREPLSRLQRVALAAAFGAILLAAGAAQAFTFDNTTNTNSDGSARYTDPDERFSGTGNNNGATTIKQGNTTLQFGTRQGADRNFNTDSMFQPNGRPMGER